MAFRVPSVISYVAPTPLKMEGVLGRRHVEHDRHDSLAIDRRQFFVQQQPRICFLFWRLGARTGPGEAAALDHLVRNAQHARLLRLVEIQTTGVVSGGDAERNRLGAGPLLLIACIEAEVELPLVAVQILVDRLSAFGDKRESAGSALARK